MNLDLKYIIDENGKPVSVVLPFEKIQKLVEEYGFDLPKEEIESIRKGKQVRESTQLIKEEYIDYKNI